MAAKLTAATGLYYPEDVFYFGNAVGEYGDAPDDMKVNATDEIAARSHPRNFADPADVTDPYDYNRDTLVNATDELISRTHPTNFLTALRPITLNDPYAE